MRSIRRSLLGYLLLLIAVALSAVGLLVDRFANGAIRTREASETERIEQTYRLRQSEAKIKFDADVMSETKALAKDAHYKIADLLGQKLNQGKGPGGPGGPGRPLEPQQPLKAPDEEAKLFRVRIAMLGLAAPPVVAPVPLTVAAFEPRVPPNWSESRIYGDMRRYNPIPNWTDYDAPRALARIQEALRKAFDEEDHRSYFQFTIVATYPNRPGTGRTISVIHSEKLGTELPFDPAWLEPNQDPEPKVDDIEIAGKKFHRVVTSAGVYGSPIRFFVMLPAPPAPIASVPPNLTGRYPVYPPFRGADIGLRVFVHHARPHSELDARLAADQKERDDQLERVRAETRMELQQLRGRLILIGTGTFAALVLGGWFIVARGLAPLRKLSDAVSQVSEKDFRLPVDAAELGRELAPIHARLTQTLMLLQRAFAREKQAVADISHELRTPIASLLATIDVALRKPRTPEQYRTTLEECRLISKQLGQLVERIMTLASLDAGNDHTALGRVDVAELVGGCAAVIRPLAAANNVTVSVHLADDLVLETDAGKLREVLMNLLHNAVEYNKPGGTIDLIARREGASAVFEVRDTGIGMSADVREKIFERFYRADASRHTTGVHAGLGLAIVKEYVARLNGSIVVESEPGVGTTFRITLPLAPAEAPLSPPTVPDRPKARDAVAASS
jgi:two-component system, OmpR family, heavy metal sensor histidine kinase CusS